MDPSPEDHHLQRPACQDLLDQMVRQARALVVRLEGVGKAELEDAIFHQVCAACDLDLTATKMEILRELMGGGNQAKGRASAGLAEVHYERGEVVDAKAMINFNLKLALCPRSACRRKAKDMEKLLTVRKEGS